MLFQEDRMDMFQKRNPAESFTVEPFGVKISEAARALGCSAATIHRLLVSSKLSAVKRGASTLVTLASLRSYEASLPPARFAPRPEAALAPPTDRTDTPT
jgi:hypothetical protein